MERIRLAIIGGGAAGLFLANALRQHNGVTVIERGERLGRKLSATGNGQGNISNLAVSKAEYFSISGGEKRAEELIRRFDDASLIRFFEELGVLCLPDERGRVYPSGRQASSLTDALRFSLQRKGVSVRLKTTVEGLKKSGGGFLLTLRTEEGIEELYAEKVALCCGGKAARNFGTDGRGYALAEGLGHTLTPLYPSLVQLKTETAHTKTLKGIRVNDGALTAYTPKRVCKAQGDIIFTDYGVSGDAVFRLSAFIAEEIPTGDCRLEIDFLPTFSKEEIFALLTRKRASFPDLPVEELLSGAVNNQIGRAIMRRAEKGIERAAALVKSFPLQITGSLGFDYAQVTKGGVPLSEVTEDLESKKASGLYLLGEVLDIDGQCGGYNLQWAYASARAVAAALEK